MITGTIHSPTSTNASNTTGAHRKPADPAVHIDALRKAARSGVLGDDERDKLHAQGAEANAVIEQQSAALVELVHRLVETEHALDLSQSEAVALRNALREQTSIAGACRRAADRWRAESADLLVANRVLRQRVHALEVDAAAGAALAEPWESLPRWAP